jgi:[ribosomal protein S5]-alanine N-acetyltransferase
MLPDLTSLVIETDRLLLKSISEAYIDAIYQEFTATIATYMYPSPALERYETEVFVTEAMRENTVARDLTMAITKRDTGEFVGCIGLHKLTEPRPEFGIWIK